MVQGQFCVSLLHILQEKLLLVQTLQTEQITLPLVWLRPPAPQLTISANTASVSSTLYRNSGYDPGSLPLPLFSGTSVWVM